jgi:intraflagellar transport protein 81
MKFSVSDEQMEDFQNLLMSGDKDMLNTIAHWCLQRFDSLQKRAYLAKFLMPIDIPPEFMNDDLVINLSAHLKELQAEFKNVHKAADKIQSSGARPVELKAEIAQLEQEHTQLQV